MRWKFKCVLKLRALAPSLRLCSLAAVHALPQAAHQLLCAHALPYMPVTAGRQEPPGAQGALTGPHCPKAKFSWRVSPQLLVGLAGLW